MKAFETRMANAVKKAIQQIPPLLRVKDQFPTFTPDYQNQRMAGATRKQLLEWAQRHEQFYGPDTSSVIHSFPDGWTIRSPQSDEDHIREGDLMNNCLNDDTNTLDGSWCPNAYQSLRDPDNIPHATWLSNGDPALGRHNSPVREKYAPYLDAHDIPYIAESEVCPECERSSGMSPDGNECWACEWRRGPLALRDPQ